MRKHVDITSTPFTQARLADVADVFSGIGVSREETAERPGERMPVIGVRDLQDGDVAPRAALDTVGFSAPSKALTYAVRTGDVLVTGRGTVLKFGLVSTETAGAIASANIIVVRPGPEVTGGALFAILSSEVFRPKIEVLRRGATTLLSLSPKDLAKLEINLPSRDEQERIAALVNESQIAYRAALEAADIRRTLARRFVDARLFGGTQNT
ncbi:restriction endonuclease subunit S [Rhodovulum sulfidophilum]|uniref:Restriction endonuclease subunit S n=1 Tax=Rhodovulum sulfidophilum TaxID=35806 RepID=A0ABS1RV66_RHOSU|nr:restriction endonuclease subunit S [Rhodovulum sulfidophilum]MBL3609993.1 restriction endonuclease subunit S [Rhodovulum sulfidophilum]MCE8454998.1 restriction endonuclease subunit S [Rhodovulum sulfidophilum]